MASNSSPLKRLEVKYLRDGVKSNYPDKHFCEICGTTSDLENHHYHTFTLLWEKFKKDNKIVIRDADHIMELRPDFYKVYWDQLVAKEEIACLCVDHHRKLHAIYGKDPALPTAEKQKRWVVKQREKYELGSKGTITS